jgi:3-methyladenine DNA glycosylase AlkD
MSGTKEWTNPAQFSRRCDAEAMDDLVRALEQAADVDVAAVLARYFQTGPGGYGEGDVFVGIKLSDLRRLTKPYTRRLFTSADWLPLLRDRRHEYRLAALVVMSQRADRGAEPERAEIYRTYLAHTAYVNNWDLVDVSAAAVVGGYLVDRDRSPLWSLARSPLLWDRRIAMISTHRFLRAGDSRDTYALAAVLLNDREDLMHKAVGWSLREAGKRVDPDELRTFLAEHATRMPRTTLRYAIEHFSPEERSRYLAMR